MRHGFTTGSCAAAAAKAAAFMLLGGNRKENIVIKTPKGIDFVADIKDIDMKENVVSCAVIKDGGDDPDVTTGAHIFATVTYADEKENDTQSSALNNNNAEKIEIHGGKGIGVVKSPGLDQSVGSAAINSVPRKMIREEVAQVMELFDCKRPLRVIISCPEGRELAEKTFNPRLGIEGGISIIGTSGIVEPMSMQAIKDTINLELRQQVSLGHLVIAMAPGNYGLDFMKKTFGFDLDRAVKCSNFIGDSIDMAVNLGVQKILLIGHIGKLIKVSGGIMNTHSKEADCRMELLASAAIEAGCDIATARLILRSLNTTEGLEHIKKAGLLHDTMTVIIDRIAYYLSKRAGDKLMAECIVFSNEEGLLGATEGAQSLLEEIL